MNYKSIVESKTKNVSNVTKYTTEMDKALIDKIFFLDKVGDTTLFADYGCADGSVLKLACSILPQCTFIGFDNSKEMIDKANLRRNAIYFTSDINEFKKGIVKQQQYNKKKCCLSLLSLIHEMYSYGPEKVKDFWKFVFETKLFHYIAIRDMCVSHTTSRQSDPISVAKIRMNYDNNLLSQWESRWGSLTENWSLTHFLLTYRYVDSWEREFRENYLPINLEDLLALIPNNFEPTYIEHFALPFIRQQVKQDFDIDLQDRTHLKLILKSKSI